AGYAYAHGLAERFEFRRQIRAHGLVLSLGMLATLLMTGLASGLTSGVGPVAVAPILWLLGYLAISVGFPFFALSATAPLLQRWFAHTGHPTGRDPYFLYAASNLGSLVALLGYPFLLEPILRLADQRSLWRIGYGLAAVLVVVCGVCAWR